MWSTYSYFRFLSLRSDCFPILSYDAATFAITFETILQCPSTTTGGTLCNPNNDAWPQFFSDRARLPSEVNLTGWCSAGHTARLCSQCEIGYFQSGRWCLQCQGAGTHAIIVIANLSLFGLLVALIYFRTPSYETSLAALKRIRQRLQPPRVASPAMSDDSLAMHEASDESSIAPNNTGLDSSSTTTMMPFSFASDSISHSMQVSSTATDGQEEEAANPLKLLIFHVQQLGIILSTSSSMPSILASFMSFISSSSGFTISSVLSIECLFDNWSVSISSWTALLAPAIVAVGAMILYAMHHRAVKRQVTLSTHSMHEDIQPNRTDDMELSSPPAYAPPLMHSSIALQPSSSTTMPSSSIFFGRWYGVCVSLAYFFVFPCAHIALSGLACTDVRQSQSHLNLYPYIPCDHTWQSTILAPSVIGFLLWFVLFPICSTLFFRSIRRRLHRQRDPSLYPICADLMKPYHSQYWWWEQVLLIRRLLLVACVCMIPSYSFYLPIALFGLIQFSALAQHMSQPYRSVWLNRGELCSLYLLLMNYFTTLVLHNSGLIGDDASGEFNGWAAFLLIANIGFILLLLGALFRTVQTHLTQWWMKLAETNILQRCRKRAGSSGQRGQRRPTKSDRRQSSHNNQARRHLSPIDRAAIRFDSIESHSSSAAGSSDHMSTLPTVSPDPIAVASFQFMPSQSQSMRQPFLARSEKETL